MTSPWHTTTSRVVGGAWYVIIIMRPGEARVQLQGPSGMSVLQSCMMSGQ